MFIYMKKHSISAYKKAGVDIEFTSEVKAHIKTLVRQTSTPHVLSEIGLFGGLFRLPKRLTEQVLVASCDGVGTKLYLAQILNKHSTVGEDIVNHCVNDILTLGARPLFFLDYIGYSEIKSEVIKEIIKGLTRACKKNRCALIGGETAMMPGMYKKGQYDLVGFIVGVVDKDKVIDGKKIAPDDFLIGLPSSGLHTNGYSLARKVFFEDNDFNVNSTFPELKKPLGEELLKPHRSYLKELLPVLKYLSGIAHITGGGFYDNIGRILPSGVSCLINKDAWSVPAIFQLIQRYGKISDEEMYRVFNMGIGIVVFVSPKYLRKVLNSLHRAQIIGRTVKGNFGVKIISQNE
jgi:phosphoribosylformylglycinamidine cyclo-ligase